MARLPASEQPARRACILGPVGRALSESRKLRHRAQFRQVYERGIRLRGRLMTCFALPNDLEIARLGISATQKLGNAVCRNRAKRLIRELFRSRNPLKGIDLVVIPRRELLDAPWPVLKAEYGAALDRIARLDLAK